MAQYPNRETPGRVQSDVEHADELNIRQQPRGEMDEELKGMGDDVDPDSAESDVDRDDFLDE